MHFWLGSMLRPAKKTCFLKKFIYFTLELWKWPCVVRKWKLRYAREFIVCPSWPYPLIKLDIVDGKHLREWLFHSHSGVGAVATNYSGVVLGVGTGVEANNFLWVHSEGFFLLSVFVGHSFVHTHRARAPPNKGGILREEKRIKGESQYQLFRFMIKTRKRF
jgi:hypothetical protein